MLVCHPRLVQTGLDLVEFPTIVWAETDYSVLQSEPNAAVYVGSEFAPSSRRGTPHKSGRGIPRTGGRRAQRPLDP